MDLDPLLSKSQGFLTELVSPLSSEQIAMPAASESEITLVSLSQNEGVSVQRLELRL